MTTSKNELPALSMEKSVEVLRGGLSLVAEQVGAALPGLAAPAVEYLVGRMESDQGAPAARRLLSSRKDELRWGFRARLQEEQGSAMKRLLKREPATAASPKITAESLTLMDDDAAATSEFVVKVARRMGGPLELALREVHLVASHLARREGVRVGDDPFAPEVFVKALLDAARDLKLEANGWAALLNAYEKPLTEQLGKSYQSLLEYFRNHRVDAGAVRRELAAKQAISRSSAAAGPATTKGPATKSPAAARLGWLDEVPRVEQGLSLTPNAVVNPAEVRASLDNLVARMQANVRGSPQPALPHPGPPPEDLISAINEMQGLGARGMPGATVGMTGADQGAWRELLLAKSNRTVDKLTIEVVGMLFDHVLQDNQVPAEIKAVLSRLQFPVLKVALTDADFFASSAHPARQLIDRLASTAIGWEPYGDENQRYKTEVGRDRSGSARQVRQGSRRLRAIARRIRFVYRQKCRRGTRTRSRGPSARSRRRKSARCWSSIRPFRSGVHSNAWN